MAIDRRKNRIEIELEGGETAIYVVAEQEREVPNPILVTDALKSGTMRTHTIMGEPNTITAPGECHVCKEKVYMCISHPIRADEEIGRYLAAFVKEGDHELATVYCQEHYLEYNPHIQEAIEQGRIAMQRLATEEEIHLATETARLGGVGDRRPESMAMPGIARA